MVRFTTTLLLIQIDDFLLGRLANIGCLSWPVRATISAYKALMRHLRKAISGTETDFTER